MRHRMETVVEVSAPLARAWSALTELDELNKWSFPVRRDEDGTTHTEIQERERKSELVEFNPMKRIHRRTTLTGEEGFGVTAGLRDNVIEFEEIASGTRISFINTGPEKEGGPGTEFENARVGVRETLADLALYLETGVGFRRHLGGEKCSLGFTSLETAAGLKLCDIQKDGFAERAGLRRDDILVEIGGAGVFGRPELGFFIKEHAAGEIVEAAWVRGSELMRGSAELGPPTGG